MRNKRTKTKQGDAVDVRSTGQGIDLAVSGIGTGCVALTPREARKVAEDLTHAARQLEREIRKRKEGKKR